MNLPRLYLITNRKQCANLYETIEESLKAGVRMIQLREKDLSSGELFELADELRSLTRRYNALLIINDRLDIALAVEADGIHVGVNSMPIQSINLLKNRFRNNFLLGYSAHSLEEAIMVQKQGVDWITFSPIYATPSKKDFGPCQGINKLKEVVTNLVIPVYALGGIKLNHITEVLDTGAYGIALISEIIANKEPKNRAAAIMEKF